LFAQQVAVLVTLWLSQHRGGPGTLNVYVYVQAVYLLPYAVVAVPVAIAAFPSMASRLDQAAMATGLDQAALSGDLDQPSKSRRSDPTSVELAEQTLASSARAITVATCVGAAVLVAIAPPTGAFFSSLDAGRDSPAGQEALAALPGALTAFAPGLVGFGMAALLTRALYVRGRPATAGAVVALGWLLAAVVPLAALHEGDGPRKTLLWLGFASSVGMTVAGAGLFVAVRGAWGRQVFRGLGRSAMVAVVSGLLSAAAGRAIGETLDPRGIAAGAAVTILVAIVVLTLGAASIWIGDRESARLVLDKIRRSGRRDATRSDATRRGSTR
jgi:putative peptidoglycan lipid II flippase